jgi:hypothetical protein
MTDSDSTGFLPSFDTLAFAERLKAAGVAPEQAKAHTEALAIAISGLATKRDLKEVKRDLLIQLGTMMVVLDGLLFTALKIWH